MAGISGTKYAGISIYSRLVAEESLSTCLSKNGNFEKMTTLRRRYRKDKRDIRFQFQEKVVSLKGGDSQGIRQSGGRVTKGYQKRKESPLTRFTRMGNVLRPKTGI